MKIKIIRYLIATFVKLISDSFSEALFHIDTQMGSLSEKRTNMPGLLLIPPLELYYNPDLGPFIQYLMGH